MAESTVADTLGHQNNAYFDVLYYHPPTGLQCRVLDNSGVYVTDELRNNATLIITYVDDDGSIRSHTQFNDGQFVKIT